MNPIVSYIVARLREPSTWAGLSILAALLGVPPGLVDAVHQIAAGAIAAGAVILPELRAPAAAAQAPGREPAAGPN